MKHKGLIVVGVLAALALLLGVGYFGTYNAIVSSSEAVEQYRGDIEANLQRRSDLIPNLVSTVKGYAAHEESIYTEIADARARLSGAGSLQEAAEADTQLTSALSRLLVVVENYPDLQASQNFRDLQTQLEGTENRIKVARTRYNEQVRDYNQRIRRFPGNIIASMNDFEKVEYFEAAPGAQIAPEVSF